MLYYFVVFCFLLLDIFTENFKTNHFFLSLKVSSFVSSLRIVVYIFKILQIRRRYRNQPLRSNHDICNFDLVEESVFQPAEERLPC